MGFFDFITGGKGEKSLDKHVARAKNKNAQSVDRYASLETLVGAARDNVPPKTASDEGKAKAPPRVIDEGMRRKAVLGLLGRFQMRYDKTIEDEQEKEYVFEQLKRLGSVIVPELEQHLHASESIAWGLRILGEITEPEEAWPVLERLCERNDNTYTRDPSKKTQLIHFLGSQDDPRAGVALIPYLEDVDEGVRFITVEGLLHHKPEAAREPLLAVLASEKEESRRIKRRIVEGLVDAGWDVRGGAGQSTLDKLVADLLPGAKIDPQGRVRRSAEK